MRKIALIGNPNSGKTTLFNQLTGASQKVGNWPGVTVEKKFGYFEAGGERLELVDLPGIYSLDREYQGIDERIARDFLDGNSSDLLVNIIDGAMLERGLVLTQQMLEGGVPIVVVVNMLDVAAQEGIDIDIAELGKRLGLPVVGMVAARGQGIDELLREVSAALAATVPVVTKQAAAKPAAAKPDSMTRDEDGAAEARNEAGDTLERYHRSRQMLDGVVEMTPGRHGLSQRIDAVVLNRWLGIPIFLLMIYVMFTVAVNLGAVFIDFFAILCNALLVDTTAWLLRQIAAPELLVTLLAQGVGGGITLVATFIPVIAFLYLCLAALEDSGYLSRAAFVIDRLMSSIGLPGNAFVPLIVGFGCNVPAVMATRSLPRHSDRLLTISMAPFMSCGARLTVYALFAAALFQENGQNIVFGLYLLGIVLAVFTGWVFRRRLFAGQITPSFQEMPAYHVPVLRNIALTAWFRLRGFIVRAGKVIVLVVVALSVLNSIGSDGSFGNEDSENSLLSVIGKGITPAFAPMGLEEGNWPATVGLFTGMFAKEAIVGTLDALYSGNEAEAADAAPDLPAATVAAFVSIGAELAALGGALTDPLGVSIGDVSDVETVAADQEVAATTLTNMASLFSSPFAAFCYLVFVLLYAPCVAVLGAVYKEAGLPWTLLVFGWSTGLAYVAATVTYQIGTFAENPLSSAGWIVALLALLGVFILNLPRLSARMAGKSVSANDENIIARSGRTS